MCYGLYRRRSISSGRRSRSAERRGERSEESNEKMSYGGVIQTTCF